LDPQPFLLFLAALLPLVFVQRALHLEVQLIFLALTRRPDISIVLFSVLFFPGVLLHEASHYVMANLLNVRTGRISLLPQVISERQLQMGYVETEQADWFRETLIGAAPLISGGIFTAYVGLYLLGLLELAEVYNTLGLEAALAVLRSLPQGADFWIWLYLAFVVSSTMLPSASDRRAWLPLGVVLAALFGVSLLAGAGPWMAENLAPYLERFLQSLAVVFAISLGLHVLLIVPLYALRRLLMAVLRLELTSTNNLP
jgi:hypothetical protein